MNRGEFEGLKVRFGADVASWPAPFRREALLFLATDRRDTISEGDQLDRLVLEATIEPTDERVLARNVLAKIALPKRRPFSLPIGLGSWSMPAALVLTVSAVGGYVAAGVETQISDNALLAFAVGVPPSELAETITFTRSNGGRL
ncbi:MULTISPECIES: hypothetical protein [unclassified Shinella]|uniref:hypothetical protein n=1 Tax=unclassified Shinella TaxID=2643062 RepID=UPI00225CA1F4|nr:hypothetical protein [Shinella sp. YE25]MDC7259442.1 hypothetical protein [Shinella sp. YE25]CAI0341473.1 conserved hypothetical protein [Rhizobiaceae bacterium]CAK7261102.1 Anti-sigma factor [Shinella sp. WSC3-e]